MLLLTASCKDDVQAYRNLEIGSRVEVELRIHVTNKTTGEKSERTMKNEYTLTRIHKLFIELEDKDGNRISYAPEMIKSIQVIE